MNNFEVRVSGEIAGTWRNAGDIISLTAAQALHLAPPLASVVTPVEEKPNGKLSGRKRRNRKAADGLEPRPTVNPQDSDDAA